jgi:predicted neutral ceramidase superfamily lipid hydrolase
MASIAELGLRLEALKKARDSGVLTVKHGDTLVEYRSVNEILDAISALTAEINKANGLSRGPRYIRQTSRG